MNYAAMQGSDWEELLKESILNWLMLELHDGELANLVRNLRSCFATQLNAHGYTVTESPPEIAEQGSLIATKLALEVADPLQAQCVQGLLTWNLETSVKLEHGSRTTSMALAHVRPVEVTVKLSRTWAPTHTDSLARYSSQACAPTSQQFTTLLDAQHWLTEQVRSFQQTALIDHQTDAARLAQTLTDALSP